MLRSLNYHVGSAVRTDSGNGPHSGPYTSLQSPKRQRGSVCQNPERKRRAKLIYATLSLLLLTFAAPAHAHRVNADAVVSDDGKSVRIEAWLSGSQTPPKGTIVILHPDGSEYKRGELTDGAYTFTPERPERFSFNIQLGEGHAKSFPLPEDQYAKLQGSTTSPTAATTAPSCGSPGVPSCPLRRMAESDLGARVLTGLAIIASLVALGMATSTNRRVRELEQRFKPPGSEGN